MTLNEQLNSLMKEAPRYGVPEVVMAQIVIPVINLFANQLTHLEYYILQTPEGDWLINVLSSRQDSQQQKTVVYAFADRQDAIQSLQSSGVAAIPAALPVAELLLQLLSLGEVDSLIFWDTPGNLSEGAEISCQEFQNLIEESLSRLSAADIPPDIA